MDLILEMEFSRIDLPIFPKRFLFPYPNDVPLALSVVTILYAVLLHLREINGLMKRVSRVELCLVRRVQWFAVNEAFCFRE
jgi:hypothetical protein